MRAFFCIPLSTRTRYTIHEIADRLRSDTRMRASWVPESNYHITLRFLGDIEPALTVDLAELCRVACKDIEPFDCALDCVGAFPNADRARVIWVGGRAPQSFAHLSQALSAGLARLGFPKAREETRVHVTLARVKDRPDPALPDLLSKTHPSPPLSVPVDHIALMESRLTAQGAMYAPLFTTNLGADHCVD